MHYLYGEKKGHICGECSNLSRYKYKDKSYRKCCIYGKTRSEATDWRCKNVACGMFNLEYDGMPVIYYKRSLFEKSSVVDERAVPIDGQINMFDGE